LLSSFILASCDTGVAGKETDYFLTIDGFEKEENKYELKINNDVESFSFVNKIHIADGYKWQLSTDKEGTRVITTQTINCEIGSNISYLLVTHKEEYYALYEVNVYRYDMFNISFANVDGNVMPEIKVQEGSLLPELTTPRKYGYTFAGWDYDITKPVTSDLVLTASWSVNYHTITFDADGGQLYRGDTVRFKFGDNPLNYVEIINDPYKTGFRFSGWLVDGVSFNIWTDKLNFDRDVTFVAKWVAIDYLVTYKPNGGVIKVDGKEYTNSYWNYAYYNQEYAVVTATRDGYSFAGWYYNDVLFTSGLYPYDHAITVTARWTVNSYNLSLSSNNDNYGTLAGSGSYDFDSDVTVIATANSGYVFNGWYSDSTFSSFLSSKTTYTFKMASSDMHLYAKFITQEEANRNIRLGLIPSINSGHLTYGLYPQSLVVDSELISSLNLLKTDSCNENGYYLFDDSYYTKLIANPYASGYSFDNGNEIVDGTEYWFKLEPISWKIMDQTGDDYYLFSDIVLDSHRFNVATTVGSKPNNYEKSEIRSWLNSDFYNKAFFLSDFFVISTNVDNSNSSTGSTSTNPNICSNTTDKVTMLSRGDMLNPDYGYSEEGNRVDTGRVSLSSEFVRANGAMIGTDNSSRYWTRTPSFIDTGKAFFVEKELGTVSDWSVDMSFVGVRPAITISIA
jgi:uncharacterized repeat protein (TIGR02543 family)